MKIFVVSATRGDYSNRTEYAIAWHRSEARAKEAAQGLSERSALQRSLWSEMCRQDIFDWGSVPSMAAAVGDPQWSPTDDTEYWVMPVDELVRGGTP